MTRCLHGFACAILFLAVLYVSPSHAATPVPAFPENGVAVAGVDDTFTGLRKFLQTFESQAGARYTVCVVANADPRGRTGRATSGSAVAYVDKVHAAWRENLNPASHVVILLALENRGIAIHPGSAWTVLGFEQGTVTQVIDQSPFARFARSGDYVGALQRLVESVDWHLALQIKARMKERDRARAGLAALRRQSTDLALQIRAVSFDTGDIHRHLSTVNRALDQAERHLQQEEIARALRAEGQARNALSAVTDSMAQAKKQQLRLEKLRREAPEELKAAQARRDSLAERLKNVPFNASDAQEYLAVADGYLAEARAFQASEQWGQVHRKAEQTVQALVAGDAALRSAADAHHFATRTLPALSAGAVLLILLLVAMALRLIRGMYRKEAWNHLREWKTMLGRAATRLVELKDRHPVLFGSEELAKKLTGTTAERYQATGRGVDELFLTYLTAQEIVDRAEKRIDLDGAFGWSHFKGVTEMLTTGEHVVGKVRSKDVHLFLPEFTEVKREARNLLKYMNTSYQEVLAQVAALEQVLVDVQDVLHAAQEALASVDERIHDEALVEYELGVFHERLNALQHAHAEVTLRLDTDPIEALSPARALVTDVATLAERLGTVQQAAACLSAADEGLTGAEALVAARRGEGLRLLEPGFEPEAMARQTRELATQSREAIAAGIEAKALAAAQEAQALPGEIERLTHASVASKADTPGHLLELNTEHGRLLEKLPDRRARIRALRQSHADDALQPALDNAEEADSALTFALHCTREANRAAKYDEQRYLAAAELVRRARRTLADVTALYDEIEHKADELAQAKAKAHEHLADADACDATLHALVANDDSWMSAHTFEKLNAMLRDLQQERDDQAAERPHWPNLEASSAALRTLAQAVVARATAEKKAQAEAVPLRSAVTQKRDRVDHLLRSHAEDRHLANERFAEADTTRGMCDALLGEERPDWIEALDLLRYADTLLDDAHQLAMQDIAAANAACDAILVASRSQMSANRVYGYGVRVDLALAYQHLKAARSLLRDHDYEAALRWAQMSRTAAVEAERAARRRARQRAEDEAAAARRRARSRSRSSGMFSSSWGGSSSRSSSSFGGFSSSSSSGGSSFGSSSGGSSFGSSSGGSSW